MHCEFARKQSNIHMVIRMIVDELILAFPQPQRKAIFLRRPQRFLAEMKLSNEIEVIAYCANPGAMTDDLSPGSPALLWDSTNPKRKRRYTWRAVEVEGLWIGTDTHLSNHIVEAALLLKLVPGLEAYTSVVREKLVETGVRVDFYLSSAQGDCLLEVKSANIVANGVARYPDSVTPRGIKHLQFLKRQSLKGLRTVILFLVQRADAQSFQLNPLADSAFVEAFEEAVASGVEVMALAVSVCPTGFARPRALPFEQSPLVDSLLNA
jgi:sugar fermentation stimulation protein A